MTSPNIATALSNAKRGDNQAVTRLYESYVEQIYRYILYRVPDVDAEDLTAEVFVKMVEGLPKYKVTGAPFEAWLYRIAAARIADYYRRNKRTTNVELNEQLSDDGPQPEDYLLREQELDGLREALSFLSDEQQDVLIMRFVERKSHQDVADVVGKSVSAVKSIQHRALKELTHLLGSDEKVRHYLRGRND